MGNRAIITGTDKKMAVYLHYNGGRDSVEAFLKYCDLQGYRGFPDDYAYSRLCQVVGNFFAPGGMGVGISPYTDDEDMACYADDNGVYVVDGWDIVDRVYPHDNFKEQAEYELDDMLEAINDSQPDCMRIPKAAFFGKQLSIGEVSVGNEVMVFDNLNGTYEVCRVVGLGEPGVKVNGRDMGGVPYVDQYGSDQKSNINNYLRDGSRWYRA